MKCAICQKEMFQEKRYVYFKIEREGIWIICKSCEQMTNCVTNPLKLRWVHLAIEKLEENLPKITDERLSGMLREDIEKRKYKVGMHKTHL